MAFGFLRLHYIYSRSGFQKIVLTFHFGLLAEHSRQFTAAKPPREQALFQIQLHQAAPLTTADALFPE
jgi:hypothetical protein